MSVPVSTGPRVGRTGLRPRAARGGPNARRLPGGGGSDSGFLGTGCGGTLGRLPKPASLSLPFFPSSSWSAGPWVRAVPSGEPQAAGLAGSLLAPGTPETAGQEGPLLPSRTRTGRPGPWGR